MDEIKKTLSKFTNSNNGEISIVELSKYINDVANDLLNKINKNLSEINKLNTTDETFKNSIYSIEKEILALKSEDDHIFKIINKLQSINETILSDIKFIKDNNVTLNNEIISLKEKIKFLTGVNVDNIESLDSAHRKLAILEKSDEELKQKIYDIEKDIIKTNSELKSKISTLDNSIDVINVDLKTSNDKIDSLSNKIENTNVELTSIKDSIDNTNNKLNTLDELVKNITGIDSDTFDEFGGIIERLSSLESTDVEINEDIELLKNIIGNQSDSDVENSTILEKLKTITDEISILKESQPKMKWIDGSKIISI